jgi:hypothetical protein
MIAMTEHEIWAELASIWKPLTLRVWRRAHFKCEYCDRDMCSSADNYQHLSNLDHVRGRAAGDDYENLAHACWPCNKIKRNIDFTDRGAVTNRDAVVAKARVYVTGIRERDSQRMHAEMALIMQLPAICVAIGDTAPVVDGPAAFSQASSSPVETIVPDARN